MCLAVAQVLLRYDDERHWLRAALAGRSHASQHGIAAADGRHPIPCGRSVITARRSELFGYAGYGYCPSHSRWSWGAKLMIICICEGTVTGFCLANPKLYDERDRARQMLKDQPAKRPAPGTRHPAPPSSPTRACPARTPKNSSPACSWA